MKYFLPTFFISFLIVLCSCQQQQSPTKPIAQLTPQSGAGQALDMWTLQRSYPNRMIATSNLTTAFNDRQTTALSRNSEANWESIGPKNIAGRTLKLAFHPTDTQTVFLGSASGGLWKTTSAGLGVEAWERVDLGFPVLAVSSIAISQSNPDVMYIGTGEMYNSEETKPGVVNRLTRGTYGFGIFKSTDGGISWEKSLDWSYQDMRAVQDIVFNPLDENVLYAATSIGLMKSENAGADWTIIHDIPMAVDVEVNPVDTNIVYVTHGSLFQENSGIFRSDNSGDSFKKLRIGIPTTYSGKAILTVDPADAKTLYASVADAFVSRGLYRSSNNGESWVRANQEDIAMFQGWYSHDVAIHPSNPRTVIQVGIDVWKSDNRGFTMEQQTSWLRAEFGKNPIGVPDGPPDYVHSDIHQAIFHPLLPNTLFLATDGGVFVSEDGGKTFASRNGGLQTTQFYANFANSTTNADFAIGGMQDNSTAIYTGDFAWTRVIGGDGMSAAIDPEQDNIIYGSAQLLNVFRSTDGGQNFEDIAPGAIQPAFSAPFEIAPSNPRVLYAGGRLLFKSTDRGNNWSTPNSNFIDDGNAILKIAVSPNNLNHLLVSTAPNITGIANIFSSTDGGLNWNRLVGLPDRIATDLVFHPENPDVAFITFGGFRSFHVYQTMDGGQNWFPIDNNLPDIPHNSLVIDPTQPDNIYIANDLGVYMSEDAGGTWSPFMEGLPEVTLAMHLSISPANQKLRVATHGNGVFETDLVGKVISSLPQESVPQPLTLGQNFPNPVRNQTTIPFTLAEKSTVSLRIFNSKGQLVKKVEVGLFLGGEHQYVIDLSDLTSGSFLYELSSKGKDKPWARQQKWLVKKEG
ncbi:MAG: T9SS type A sorting domain-containing protein [Bacteroidota bacterium]